MKKQEELKPIDKILKSYSDDHQHPLNRVLQFVCIPLALFGLLGIIWAIPFPSIAFLGKYNGYVNWASFFIAFLIYFYYRLSPALSYLVLLLIFACSAGIVTLEKYHRLSSWPEMHYICGSLFLLSLLILLFGQSLESKKMNFITFTKSLFNGPVWIFHFVLKKLGIKM